MPAVCPSNVHSFIFKEVSESRNYANGFLFTQVRLLVFIIRSQKMKYECLLITNLSSSELYKKKN